MTVDDAGYETWHPSSGCVVVVVGVVVVVVVAVVAT